MNGHLTEHFGRSKRGAQKRPRPQAEVLLLPSRLNTQVHEYHEVKPRKANAGQQRLRWPWTPASTKLLDQGGNESWSIMAPARSWRSPLISLSQRSALKGLEHGRSLGYRVVTWPQRNGYSTYGCADCWCPLQRVCSVTASVSHLDPMPRSRSLRGKYSCDGVSSGWRRQRAQCLL